MLTNMTAYAQDAKTRKPIQYSQEPQTEQQIKSNEVAEFINTPPEAKIEKLLAASRARKHKTNEIVHRHFVAPSEVKLDPSKRIFATTMRGVSFMFKNGKKIQFNNIHMGQYVYMTGNTEEIQELKNAQYVRDITDGV